MNWLLPSKPPTPSEWAVLFWSFVVLLVLAGLGGIVGSFFVPAEKHELAVQLVGHSVRTLLAGLGLGVGLIVIRRFLD